jgi:hypothetical protein
MLGSTDDLGVLAGQPIQVTGSNSETVAPKLLERMHISAFPRAMKASIRQNLAVALRDNLTMAFDYEKKDLHGVTFTILQGELGPIVTVTFYAPDAT